jgi:PAS domain S-box-containing protein
MTRLSLSAKFIFVFITIISTTSLISSFYLIRGVEKGLLKEYKNRADLSSSNLAYNSEYGVLASYKESLDNLVGASVREPDVIWVSVKDGAGATLSEKGRRTDPIYISSSPVLTKQKMIAADPGKKAGEDGAATEDMLFQEVGKDAPHKINTSRIIGTAYVGISLVQMNKKLAAARSQILYLTIVTNILGAFGALLLVRILTGPIRLLMTGTENIAKGNFEYKVKVKSRDEIGALAVAFNQMGENLRISRSKLVEAKEYSDNIINSMIDTLIVLNPNMTVRTVNPATIALLGYEEGELIGKPVEMLLFAEQKSRMATITDELLRVGAIANCESAYKTKNGVAIPIIFSGTVINDAEGKMIGIVVIAKDITERKRVEEEITRHRERLEELVKERTADIISTNEQLELEIAERKQTEMKLQHSLRDLEAINKELDSFTYTASHDMKEPLRSISTFSNFILEDYSEKLDGDGKDYLKRIIAGTIRMQALIDDLLALSRISRIKNPYVSVDSGVLVSEAVKRLDLNIEEKKAKVRIDDELPFIYCDRVKMLEVICNLISNALKYNDKPEPRIDIFAKKMENSEGKACIEFFIKDNGIGIKEEHYESIFQIFRRLHGRDEYGGGTGAGLAIVNRIIEEHKGEIRVESEEGEGSAFIITLPAGGNEVN